MKVLYDYESGDMLIERDGVIVARVSREIEQKWPGIANQMAASPPLKVTMSPDLSSAEVGYSRDGDLCFVSLKAGECSVHNTDVSLHFDDVNRARAVVAAIKGKKNAG